MKELNLSEFSKKIENKRSKVNEIILDGTEIGNTKSRVRDKDEIEILNIITKSRWEKAVSQGKIKKTGKNTFDYFFD